MAKMIPPSWEDRNGSRAEGVIYRKLRSETPEDWYAIHSVGLLGHEFKSWAEIDFVVIGPFGVICLEVKGGRITVDDGQWFTNQHRLRESPFQQSGGGAAALRAQLRKRYPMLKKALVEFGVAFPDVRFEGSGPSIEQKIVFDERDLGDPIEKFLDRVTDYWRSYRELSSDRFRPLSRGDRSAVASWIAPRFDLVPSLGSKVKGVEAELVVLTEGQTKTLRGMWSNDRVLVTGGAGTGKTLLAVEEAQRLAADGMRVLFCCRSEPLAEYLRELLGESDVDVRALEPLMWDLVKRSGREERLPDAVQEDLFAVFLPQEALEGALELELESYDALVLDEAQDLLLEPAIDLFDLLLAGGLQSGVWRVFLDHKQRVFSSFDPVQWARLTQSAITQFTLVDNCRNTPQIASITALLAALDPDAPLASDGPRVETRFVLNREDEVREVAEISGTWVKGGIDPESIVILGSEPTPPADLAAVPARWARIEDFKGLETSAAVVTGIEDLSSADMLRRAYVGCSRARSLLAVMISEAAAADFAVRAQEFEERHGVLEGTS